MKKNFLFLVIFLLIAWPACPASNAAAATVKNWHPRLFVLGADQSAGQASLDRVRSQLQAGGIFTMPEVATVGLTESQAMQQGINARADSVLFRSLGKAQAMGDTVNQPPIDSIDSLVNQAHKKLIIRNNIEIEISNLLVVALQAI